MTQPKVLLDNTNTREIKCSCKGEYFHMAVKLRYAPPLVTGQQKGMLVTTEPAKWVCSKCGKVLESSKIV